MPVDLGVQTRRRLHHQGIPSSHAALVSRTATPAREGRPAADPPLVGRSVPAYVFAGRVVLVPAGYRAAPPDRHPRRSGLVSLTHAGQARVALASRFAPAPGKANRDRLLSLVHPRGRGGGSGNGIFPRAGTAPSGEIPFLDPPNGPSAAPRPTRQAARSAYGAAPHNRCLEQLSSTL